MPGFTFPTVGPLGLGSPPSRTGFASSSVLCSATTANSPSPVPSLSLVPRYPAFSSLVRVPSFSARCSGWSSPCQRLGSCLSSVPHLLTYGKETVGSPKFPRCPREHMPRSQTPVVSCTLALSRLGLLPSGRWTPSAFPSSASFEEVIPSTTIIHISRLNHAACALVSLSLILPLPGLHVRFPTALLARL
jgi:hypothetical protein